jgi:hypothetical protein
MKQTIRTELEVIDDYQIVPILAEHYKTKYPDKEIIVEIEGNSNYDEERGFTYRWVAGYIYNNRPETDEEYSRRLQKEKEKEDRGRKAKIILAQTAADSLKAQYERKLEELEKLRNDETGTTQ